MPDRIDEIYARWRQRPDPATTVALCNELRGSDRENLVVEVGAFATREYASNVLALIAAGRMYMEANKLEEAQATLVNAGRVAPREGVIYRWLGEALLRRGDADRAEKVLERALQFGSSDPDTRMWLERARVLKPMQARGGTRAVAAEVAKAAPLGHRAEAPGSPKKLPPMRPPMDSEGEKPTLAREVPPELKPHLDELREQSSEMLRQLGKQPRGEQASAEKPARNEAPTAPPPKSPATAGGAPIKSDMPTRAGGFAPMSLDGQTISPGSPPLPTFPAQGAAPNPFLDSSPAPNPFLEPAPAASPFAPPATANPFAAPPAQPAPPPPVSAQPFAAPAASAQPFSAPAVPAAPVSAPSSGKIVSPRGQIANPFARTARDLGSPDKPKMPEPRDVLDALALAGVFERSHAGGAAVTWDKPEKSRGRRRGSILLVIATVLFIAGGVGLFFFVRDRRAKAHMQAEALLQQVEADMSAGSAQSLAGMEQSIGKAFELESRSPRAALVWLRERALVGLLKGGSELAFEDAIARAKEVGVPEQKIAFSHVASFLFQGDTAGALSMLSRWDQPAADDAWYQLMAGATLERAGDAHAVDRYTAAAKLDPASVVAEISLARAMAIDGDPQKAGELARAFRAKYKDRPEGVALVALAWGRDPMRGDPPPEVAELPKISGDLPVSLKATGPAVAALRALEKHAHDEAKAEVNKGLLVVWSPGFATWLGDIAIEAGDEQLARKAALSAVSFSAVYPPARVLAARVALAAGRLDEALKAVEELDQTSISVAIVRAAASYERGDSDGLSRAWGAVPQEMRSAPFVRGLSIASDVLEGRVLLAPEKLVDLGKSEAPWADVIAMDLALDTGDVATAEKIAAAWGDDPRPPRALRLARLARYSGKLDVADKMMTRAFTGTVTPRVILEEIYLSVAKEKAADVAATIKKYPLVLGSLSPWASAYGAASGGRPEEARAKTTTAEIPPAAAPLPARMLVAAALGAMKDRRRAGEMVKPILAAGLANPDVGAAAVAAGYKKVETPGKKTTYVAP